MMQSLDFDTLKKLAKSNPKALESLRRRLIEDFIQSAPESSQRRLRGLQFRIDMERDKASNAMSSCVAISQMMHNSFEELRKAVYTAQNMTKESSVYARKSLLADTADILPFKR